MTEKVTFMPSFTNRERVEILERCLCLVYTPRNEHFGIVPIEAMYCQRPVIAVASGGPLETVVEGTTGRLCDDTPEDFAKAMAAFLPSLVAAMAAADKAWPGTLLRLLRSEPLPGHPRPWVLVVERPKSWPRPRPGFSWVLQVYTLTDTLEEVP